MAEKDSLRADLFADRLVASYVDDQAFITRPWLTQQIETAITVYAMLNSGLEVPEEIDIA